MGEGASLPTVWRHAIADPEAGLTPTQKLVALMISAHMNGTGVAWPSVPTLAEECGLHPRTVRRAKEALSDCGLLIVDLGGGRSKPNRYRAAIPGHLRQCLAEKGVHQRPETGAPASLNGGTRAPRSSKEVDIEGASPDLGEGLNTEHIPDNPWCRCPDCRNGKTQEPQREETEPNPATDGVAPEVVSSHG